MYSGLAANRPSEAAPTVVRLPRIVPRSLFSRSLLIVIMPLLILQAVLAYIFYERHWDSVTRWLASGFAGEVGMVVELLAGGPDACRPRPGCSISRATIWTSPSRWNPPASCTGRRRTAASWRRARSTAGWP